MSISTRNDFLDLIGEVGQNLPGNWELVPFPADYNWGGSLVNHEGQYQDATIVFSAGYVPHGGSCEKMEIRGELPKNAKGESPYIGYGKKMPAINVSTSKTGLQIAKDETAAMLIATAGDDKPVSALLGFLEFNCLQMVLDTCYRFDMGERGWMRKSGLKASDCDPEGQGLATPWDDELLVAAE